MVQTRLVSDERCDDVPELEERSTNGISQSASPGVGQTAPHLKCFYTNARTMRSKGGAQGFALVPEI